MNEYFEELVARFKKISDIPMGFDESEFVISRDEALGIILDVQEKFNNNLWNLIYKNRYPESKYGESSRPVLVRYKDETANPEVCSYNFITKKFIFLDKDVTEFVKEWCEIPGYGYDQ